MNDYVQLRILIALITLCFTGIFGLMGYLAKKLIDDIKNNLESFKTEMQNHSKVQNEHAVKIAQHEIHIDNLRKQFKL